MARSPEPRTVVVCFDWGGTLMNEQGPAGVPMYRWPAVHCVEGARETLAALHGRFTLCLATNAADSAPDEIAFALDRAGLGRFLSRIFCQRVIGVRKESPRFWDAVLRELGVPAEQVVMVGDTFEADVRVPRACGLRAYWFNPAPVVDTDPEGFPVLSRLTDCVSLLAGAGSPAGDGLPPEGSP